LLPISRIRGEVAQLSFSELTSLLKIGQTLSGKAWTLVLVVLVAILAASYWSDRLILLYGEPFGFAPPQIAQEDPPPQIAQENGALPTTPEDDSAFSASADKALMGTWSCEWSVKEGKTHYGSGPNPILDTVTIQSVKSNWIEGMGNTPNFGEYLIRGFNTGYAVALTYRGKQRPSLAGTAVFKRQIDPQRQMAGQWAQLVDDGHFVGGTVICTRPDWAKTTSPQPSSTSGSQPTDAPPTTESVVPAAPSAEIE
jgi:hypothetical protein